MVLFSRWSHQTGVLIFWLLLWYCHKVFAQNILVFDFIATENSSAIAWPVQLQVRPKSVLKYKGVRWYYTSQSQLSVCSTGSVSYSEELSVQTYRNHSSEDIVLVSPVTEKARIAIIETEEQFIPCSSAYGEAKSGNSLVLPEKFLSQAIEHPVVILPLTVQFHVNHSRMDKGQHSNFALWLGSERKKAESQETQSYSGGGGWDNPFDDPYKRKGRAFNVDASDLPIDIDIVEVIETEDSNPTGRLKKETKPPAHELQISINGQLLSAIPLNSGEFGILVRMMDSPGLVMSWLSNHLRRSSDTLQVEASILNFLDSLSDLSTYGDSGGLSSLFTRFMQQWQSEPEAYVITLNLNKAYAQSLTDTQPPIQQLADNGKDQKKTLISSSGEGQSAGEGSIQQENTQGKGNKNPNNSSRKNGADAQEPPDEASMILAQVERLKFRLNEQAWLYIGVALELPISDLLPLLASETSERLKKMLELAKEHDRLAFSTFIHALKILHYHDAVTALIDGIKASSSAYDKSLLTLSMSDDNELVYQYSEGQLSGGAIVNFAVHYGPMTTVPFSTPMAARFQHFSTIPLINFKVLPLIINLLLEREQNRLNFASLRGMVPEWGTYDAMEAFGQTSDIAYHPPDAIVGDSEWPFLFQNMDRQIQLEAEQLLSDRYRTIIENRLPKYAYEALHYALGLPLRTLSGYLRKKQEQYFKITLDAAKKHRLLTFQNMMTALSLCTESTIVKLISDQSINDNDGVIDSDLAEQFQRIKRADFLKFSHGRVTNLVLIELSQGLAGSSLDDFYYRAPIESINCIMKPSVHRVYWILSSSGALHETSGSLSELYEWLWGIGRKGFVHTLKGLTLTGFRLSSGLPEPFPPAPVPELLPNPHPVISRELVTVTVTSGEPPPPYPSDENKPFATSTQNYGAVVTQQPSHPQSTPPPRVQESPESDSCLNCF